MTELRELSDLLDKEYEIKHLERLTGRHKPLQHISTVDITSGSVHSDGCWIDPTVRQPVGTVRVRGVDPSSYIWPMTSYI